MRFCLNIMILVAVLSLTSLIVHFEDCFYVTTDKNKILKVWVKEDGTHAYEQINQNNTGTTDGFLTDEAKFQFCVA